MKKKRKEKKKGEIKFEQKNKNTKVVVLATGELIILTNDTQSSSLKTVSNKMNISYWTRNNSWSLKKVNHTNSECMYVCMYG